MVGIPAVEGSVTEVVPVLEPSAVAVPEPEAAVLEALASEFPEELKCVASELLVRCTVSVVALPCVVVTLDEVPVEAPAVELFIVEDPACEYPVALPVLEDFVLELVVW